MFDGRGQIIIATRETALKYMTNPHSPTSKARNIADKSSGAFFKSVKIK
jgi:hypothetical protein